MTNFQKLNKIEFPEYTGVKVNMMPIYMGAISSLPKNLQQYWPMIKNCNFENGKIVYLSVHESIVEEGKTQRRPGIHTDATNQVGWGGWGGGLEAGKGIYMASTDGKCKIWNHKTFNVDSHGGVKEAFDAENEIMEANTLYWLGDRTPHESLPVEQTGPRQFFRLVSPEIGVWYSKHNTPSYIGLKPNALISDIDKFL